jgi:AraC family transcriptional regulator
MESREVRRLDIDSRSEYTARMHRVVEHIDRHLDEPLELETLASVANFSPFHFHRLFSSWMGETLGDYVRRRRLELGAQRLIGQPAVPVLEVALSVGFGSTEAFARAFKTRFGLTPSSWRSAKDRNRSQVNSKPGQASSAAGRDHGVMQTHIEEASMNVKLIDRKPTTVAYLRHVGPYGPDLSRFWQETVYPWMQTNELLDRPRYGISLDDPGITAPEKCRYDAAVEVEPGFVGAGQHLTTSIPGGKYAAARFRGTAAEIGDAWMAVLRDWLPGSGLQLDARPLFEYYPTDVTMDHATGVYECDICIPVLKL